MFGLKAPFCGINIPQEMVADFVNQHSDRFIGWCSVDPNDEDCVDQLVYNVEELGLRGLKVAPIYQNFDPQDRKHLPLFKKAEALDIPVIWHQGTSFVRPGPLKYSNPIFLEDIAVACPNLRMIIAHMGHSVGDRLRGTDSQAPPICTSTSLHSIIVRGGIIKRSLQPLSTGSNTS